VASAVPPGVLPLEILVQVGKQHWKVVIAARKGP
jgi:hypothetical protein